MSEEFSASLKYDLASQDKANEALQTVTSENLSNTNFEVQFSVDGQFLLASIKAKSSELLQEGLNAVYPVIDKVF
ncbi:hypothetical protein TRFO_21027 [Tritrichomonas foetus]|uniref:Uncharacterized protein n=1 Tax=Tritrichomonas foetus TaxID=1144522 RepID=A0A1J4KER0_9EUKA|nr:hypothetical protein TRFO_21027 [Tritrichomonas foetus]|eukprot:OHT09937.1 hypothetical protein TRFO_21027 [Tritrichomonas foetus]